MMPSWKFSDLWPLYDHCSGPSLEDVVFKQFKVVEEGFATGTLLQGRAFSPILKSYLPMKAQDRCHHVCKNQEQSLSYLGPPVGRELAHIILVLTEFFLYLLCSVNFFYLANLCHTPK